MMIAIAIFVILVSDHKYYWGWSVSSFLMVRSTVTETAISGAF
jgi:hypothetical protein